MGMNIGQLEIDLIAQTARLQADMNQVKSIMGGTFSEVQRIANATAESMQRITTVAQGLGIALGVGTFTHFISGAIESAASLQELRERTGVSVEALSGLRSVAKLSGTDMSEVATGLQKLSKNMVEARGGTGAAADAFKYLGVSVVDTSGRLKTADQVFVEVAKANDAMGAGVQTTASLMAILGKSGANLGPVLSDIAEQGSLVGKITAEQAMQADLFQKEMVKLGGSLKGAATVLALDLLPAIRASVDLIKPAIVATAAWIGWFQLGPPIITAVGVAFDAFAVGVYNGTTALDVFNASMATTVATTKAAIVQFGLLNTAFATVFSAVVGWEIGTWMRDNFLMARIAGNTFVESLLVGWEHVKYGAEVAWVGIKTAFQTAMSGAGEAFAWLLRQISAGLSHLPELAEFSAQVGQMADQMKLSAQATVPFSTAVSDLSAKHTSAVAGVRAIIKEMNVEAVQAFQTAQVISKHAGATVDLGNGSAKAASEYAKLIDKLNSQIAAGELQLQTEEKLSSAQKQALDLMVRLRDGTLLLTEAQRIQVASKLEQLLVTERHLAAQQAEAKLQADIGKDNDDIVEQLRKRTLAMQDSLDADKEQLLQLRLGDAGYKQLTITRMRDTAAQMETIAATSTQSVALMDQVRIMRERADIAEEGIILKEAQAAAAEWKKTTDQIGAGLTDSLMRAFESGKGFMQAFRDTLVNTFKTLVLKPIIQPIVNGASGSLGSLGNSLASMLGLGGSGGAMAGTGDSLSMLASGSGMLSSLLSGGSNFLAGIGAGFGESLSMGAGLMEAGATMGGLGAMVGSVAPYLAAAYALYKMLGSGGTPHVGAMLSMDQYGTATALAGQEKYTKAETWNAVSAIGGSALTSLNLLSKTFGGAGGYTGRFGFKADGEDASYGYLSLINSMGKQVAGWSGTGSDWRAHMRDYQVDATKSLESYTKDVATAVRSTLGSIDMPRWAKDALNSLGSNVTLDQLNAAAAQISQTNAQLLAMSGNFAQLGGIFGRIATQSSDAQYQLAQFSGGIDKLVSNASSFVQQYYSGGEQQGLQAASLLSQFKALGLTEIPQTLTDFRQLVEGQNLNTEEGRLRVAALLEMSSQFASVQQYLTQQGTTLADLAKLAPQGAVFSELTNAQQRQADAAAAQAELAARQAAAAESTAASIVSMRDLLGSKLDDLGNLLAGKLDNLRQAVQEQGY